MRRDRAPTIAPFSFPAPGSEQPDWKFAPVAARIAQFHAVVARIAPRGREFLPGADREPRRSRIRNFN
jgi:hypothetical protein